MKIRAFRKDSADSKIEDSGITLSNDADEYTD
jgi:hypothetical protein